MAFPSEVPGLIITRDSRASGRGKGTPVKVTVTHKAGSRSEVLRTAFAAKNPPFALVDTDGRVHIVSAGGGIWTHGEPSDAQDDAVELLKQAMIDAFGIEIKPKKKAAKVAPEPIEPPQTDPWDKPQAWTPYGVGPDPF